MLLINRKSSYYPWFKLDLLGFTGGFIGSYIAAFCLDFFNPLDLLIPPVKATVWACTCAFLGFSVVNSLLIAKRMKKKFIITFIIFSCFFLLHSILFKTFILGVGKLFIVAGFGLGLAMMISMHRMRNVQSTIKKGINIAITTLVVSFVVIGARYFIGAHLFFEKPIDLEIWFSWTFMSAWIAFFFGFEKYIS